MVGTEMDPNDLFAAGAGMRFKLTKRLSLNAEYYYVIPPMNDYRSEKTYNPLSIGVDIETGGHVFQIHLTNSLAMIEKGFIGETRNGWMIIHPDLKYFKLHCIDQNGIKIIPQNNLL
jgi:hypothetical protein